MNRDSLLVLKELEDQLTCNICLEEYCDPKALSCLHRFCMKCIENIIKVYFIYI